MSRRECSSKADFSNFQFNSNLDFIFQRLCLLGNADKKSAVHWTAILLTWSAVLTLKMWSSWWKREWNSSSICLPSMGKRSRLKWQQRLAVTKTRLNKINFHFCSGIYKFGLELHCSWINVGNKKLPDKTVYQHFSLSQVELTSAEGSGNAVDIYCLFPLLVHCWRYCIPYEKQKTFYLDDVRRKINQIFYIPGSSPFRVDTICSRHAKCEVSSVQ